jgi:DNA repair exonuclease SbcCD ATPase subunit
MNSSEQEHRTYNKEVDSAKNNSLPDTNNSQFFGKNASETGSLDKIRDILFGNQTRDYEQKFSRLEERLTKECSNLREDTKKRLDSIEAYITNEVDALTERLKTEQTERKEAVNELNQDFKNLIKSLEKKISQLDEQTSQNQRDLRQQILDQSKNLDDEIQQNHEEILAALEREAKELRTHKTDRSALANLFAELAVRLNHES